MSSPYSENFAVDWIRTNTIATFAENYPESSLTGDRYGAFATSESDNPKSGRRLVSGQSGLRALRGDVGATERFALPRAPQSLAERQTADEDGRR